jgi:pyruvate/2-oxoglutarate dehydrogenase complex dihydrolipoamide acyltransferase (E2) component
MAHDLIGSWKEVPVSPSRTAVWDTVRLGKSRPHVPILLEADVTAARASLADRAREGASVVSFTAWAVHCIAKAAGEHPRIHAVRRGRRRLVLFRDVDVSLAIYRRLNGGEADERIPMPYVLRRAEAKSVATIAAEMRAALSVRLAPGEQWLDPLGDVPPPWLLRLAYVLPQRLRQFVYWDRMLANPWRVKKTMGTVMITAVPGKSKASHSGWFIPLGIHPLVVAIGGVSRKPWVIDERIEPRDILAVTVLFDHDVIDGVPAARFLRRLVELLEGADGL